MNFRVLVIVGPTACGKTHLAVEAAHRLGSEIVSADSRQVYCGLDIGTGKDLHEYQMVDPPVAYHLIDIVDPDETYTLFRYQQDCYRVLRQLAARKPFAGGGVPAIMVGGSGLYVEAVIRDYRLADVPRNTELREALKDLSRDELLARFEREQQESCEDIDTSSRRRLIRTLEITEHGREHPVRYGARLGISCSFCVFGVLIEKGELRRRIGARLRARLNDGLVEEVRGLLERGLSPRRLEDLGLEYREIAAYLRGEKGRQKMIADLEQAIARFAKRQQTWFRGMVRRGVPIHWIGPDDVEAIVAAGRVDG
jgi:tRNA dimethylallyltransferase